MDALPLVISSGWAAGVNAYATVLLLGVFGRLGLGDVPDGLENPGVIAAAAVLYAVEFVTDKVPYVDNLWDTVHTAIRPTIAAALGVLLAGDATGLEDALAAVGSGGTALASHAVKAGLRAAVNLSPDPVTTATASLTEDFCVGVVVVLIVTHPWAALTLAAILLVIGLLALRMLWRAIRARSSPAARQSS